MKAGQTLRSILSDHLKKGGASLTYPKIEFNIVSIGESSIRVTDDNQHYFELTELADQIKESLPAKLQAEDCRVKLHRWSFEVHKVPNTKKTYLDLTCRNME